MKLAAPVKTALGLARAAPPSAPAGDDRILVTARGGDPWTGFGFRASWAKAEAGVVGRTFHDLRETAATMSAMAGAGVPEIATMTGHSLSDVQSILDKDHTRRDERASGAGVDTVDVMLAAMAAIANDAAIGGEREPRRRNGITGRKRRARDDSDEAA